MKKLITKLLLVTLFLMSNSIWALCIQPGLYNQTLGITATAKDKYRVTCPAGTKQFMAQVRDQAPIMAPIIYINITASSKSGSNNPGIVQDTVDGNGDTTICGNVPLPPLGFGSFITRTLTTTNITPVTFDFEVYKSVAGAEIYSVNEQCRNAAGTNLGHGANLQILQNQ